MAFNAIISASVTALGVSYGIPVALNILSMRRKLPERQFKLPGPLGWACNIIGLVYTLITTVLFVFPPFLPVSGSSMNYCIVAFAIIFVISGFQWLVDGRKNFEGPRITIDDSAPEEVRRQLSTAGTQCPPDKHQVGTTSRGRLG